MTLHLPTPWRGPATNLPAIADRALIERGLALGCASNIDAIVAQARILAPALRNARCAELAALWIAGCPRAMDEGLLADAICRSPGLARTLRRAMRAQPRIPASTSKGSTLSRK